MNDVRFGTTLTPCERAILFECELGTCPVCGRLRGYSVPDDCDENPQCPEPWDIERSLLPQETLR